jgi:formate dehydrogenase major subunit/formate dehydrogenase alpha subunit
VRPLVRRDGKLEAASWDAALDHIAGRLQDLIQAGKPIGVLGSPRATNEENYLAVRLARAGLGTNHLDFCYHSLCRALLAGIEDVTGDSSHSIRLADIESSNTIVLVEGDLANTHARAASSVLRALASGARLIVIGCARTQMARVASCFLQTAPGREGDGLNGLLAAAIRTQPTEGKGAAASAGLESLRSQLVDVSVTEQMRVAAAWLAAERAVFLIGPGGDHAGRRRQDAAAMASLAAITGHLEKPGSGLLPLLARSNVRGACDVGLVADRLPGYSRIDDREARQRVERIWRKAVPMGSGLDAAAMLESVSGLILLADNPEAVLPAGRRVRAAMERLDFLVVLDAFATPAVEAAHAVLPIASYAETEGTFTNIENRIQKVRPATAPPGEARDGWRVLADLCARFGTGGAWSSANDIFREITEAVPRYASAAAGLSEGGWGSSLVGPPACTRFALQGAVAAPAEADEHAYVLALDGTFDWGGDPLVASSPTLRRDYQSTRKLFPGGFVEMNNEDAEGLGVREGWRVKLNSVHGEAVVPIRQRKDLLRGVLLAPYAFRDCLSGVLHEGGVTAVNVERA